MRSLLVGVPLALVMLFTSSASAATFLVTTNANSGPGSFRDALTQANTAGGANTIDLSGIVSISLESPLPTITNDLTISGSAIPVAIMRSRVGTPNFRILAIGPNSNVRISGVSLWYGVDVSGAGGGGGIFVDTGASLTLTDSVVRGNSAGGGFGGGIYAAPGSTLTVTNCRIFNNSAPSEGGGGIFAAGTLSVSGSTIESNAASYGGALHVRGNGTVTDTVITDNHSGAGTVRVEAEGSLALVRSAITKNDNTQAIFTHGKVTLKNSTISGNTSPTSNIHGYGNSASLVIESSTLVGPIIGTTGIFMQGHPMEDGATVTLRNSIISGTTTACNVVGRATLTSLGHNIASDASCSLGAAGDKPSTDPMLGPLADNGGPTQTHALLAGSPAIDNGDNTDVFGTDQRGFERIFNATVDIGAFEEQPVDLDAGVGDAGSEDAGSEDAGSGDAGTDAGNDGGVSAPDAAAPHVDSGLPGPTTSDAGATLTDGGTSAPSASDDSGGCAATGGSEAPSWLTFVGVALAITGLRSRRRRSRSQRRSRSRTRRSRR